MEQNDKDEKAADAAVNCHYPALASRLELIQDALAQPFPAEDIEWRIQSKGSNANGPWGLALAYVTNRAIMERLDEVMGLGGWQNRHAPGPNGSTICGLGLYLPNPHTGQYEWVWKHDGTGTLAANDGGKGLSDSDARKGDFSNAMKRAAVQWGIGRYLYNLESGWVSFSDEKTGFTLSEGGQRYNWVPPRLPAWALPGGEGKPPASLTGYAPAPERTASGSAPAPSQRPPQARSAPAPTTGRSQAGSAPQGGNAAEDNDPAHYSAGEGFDPAHPACPECGGAMYDNRADNRTSGKNRPAFKCKANKDHVVWKKDPKKGSGSGSKTRSSSAGPGAPSNPGPLVPDDRGFDDFPAALMDQDDDLPF